MTSRLRRRTWFYLRKSRETLRQWDVEMELLDRYDQLVLGRGVQIVNADRLHIDGEVVIQSGCFIHCGGMRWSEGRGRVSIGAGSVLAPYCVLFGAGEIEIGKRLDCGPGSMIFSSRSRYEASPAAQAVSGSHVFGKVTIEDDVTLFAGCIIGPGVTIGRGAAVAAGSVVLDDIPEHALVAGAPARQIKDLGSGQYG